MVRSRTQVWGTTVVTRASVCIQHPSKWSTCCCMNQYTHTHTHFAILLPSDQCVTSKLNCMCSPRFCGQNSSAFGLVLFTSCLPLCLEPPEKLLVVVKGTFSEAWNVAWNIITREVENLLKLLDIFARAFCQHNYNNIGSNSKVSKSM